MRPIQSTLRWYGLLILSGLLPAQQNVPVNQPLFTAGANSIALDVAVYRNQIPVTGLVAEDFILLENGQARSILGFTREELPLDIVLVAPETIGKVEVAIYLKFTEETNCKLTRSSRGVTETIDHCGEWVPSLLDWLRNSAANALKPMRPEDRVGIVVHGWEPHVVLPFTNSRDHLAATIRQLGASPRAEQWLNPAALPVTLEYAIRMLAETTRTQPETRVSRRRLIVRLMLGEVAYWGLADEPMIQRMWAQDIIFSAIGWNIRYDRLKDPTRREPVDANFRLGNYFHIAQATGGDAILSLDPKDPPDLLTRARQRYRMFFDQPPNLPPGQERKITVELSPEAKKRFPGAVVQARQGYVTR